MTRPAGFSPAIREWLQSLALAVPARLRQKELGVAVSGGSDSVALLLILLQLQDTLGFRLCVLHVDHHLRPGSEDDADWVESLAKACGLPCLRTRLNPPEKASLRREGLESWARRQRLAWLAAQAHTLGLAVIALGHHQQDQAETVLWRLLRGCSTAGLGGLRSIRRLKTDSGTITLWRPLLNTPPELLKRFLSEARQDWREDPTNTAAVFFRNRIRHQVLPYLSEFQPQIIRHLSSLGRMMGEVHRHLATQARRFLIRSAPKTLFWKGSPTGPVLRELLRQWWIREMPEHADRFNTAAAARLEDLLAQNKSGRHLDLGFVQVARVPSGLEIISSHVPQLSSRTALPLGLPVDCHGQRITLRTPESMIEPRSLTLWIDASLVERGLQIGPPARGDRFTPAGHTRTRSLARWLIERKVPRHRRSTLCVIACGDEVLWVPEPDFRSLHLHEEPGSQRFPISLEWNSAA